jgi:cytochrome c oxidase accessory protein FixG
MFDKDTLIIAYDAARGEPRGSRRKSIDPRSKGLGDCVDCGICVQVCPTGIDIRKGLQYECIGCAACIDGCNQVMGKMGYPKGLIRYVSEHGLAKGFDGSAMLARFLRPRVLIYTGILVAIIVATAFSLASRNPLKVDVLRDRGALAREAAPGVIENVYRVQIMNTDETPRRFTIEASGLPGIRVVGVEQPVAVEAAGSRLMPLRLQVGAEAAPPGTHRIELHVRAVEDAGIARDEHSTFILPRP